MRRFVPFAKKSQGRNMVRKFRGDTSSTKVQLRPNGEAAKQFSTNTARIEEFTENLYAAYKVLVTPRTCDKCPSACYNVEVRVACTLCNLYPI